MDFSGGEIGGWCALVPNIVNAISTHGEMSSVWFNVLFSWSVIVSTLAVLQLMDNYSTTL
jgi:hypothetical protein